MKIEITPEIREALRQRQHALITYNGFRLPGRDREAARGEVRQAEARIARLLSETIDRTEHGHAG